MTRSNRVPFYTIRLILHGRTLWRLHSSVNQRVVRPKKFALEQRLDIFHGHNGIHEDVCCEAAMKRSDRNAISELPIRELLYRWPDIKRAFLDMHMACIGCPFSRFGTAHDAARNYGREVDTFLEQLAQCVQRRRKSTHKRINAATKLN